MSYARNPIHESRLIGSLTLGIWGGGDESEAAAATQIAINLLRKGEVSDLPDIRKVFAEVQDKAEEQPSSNVKLRAIWEEAARQNNAFSDVSFDDIMGAPRPTAPRPTAPRPTAPRPTAPRRKKTTRKKTRRRRTRGRQTTVCIMEGCVMDSYGRPLCRKHYCETIGRPFIEICQHPGCETFSYGKPLCREHYYEGRGRRRGRRRRPSGLRRYYRRNEEDEEPKAKGVSSHRYFSKTQAKTVCTSAVLAAFGIDACSYNYSGHLEQRNAILRRNGWASRSRNSHLNGGYRNLRLPKGPKSVGGARKIIAWMNKKTPEENRWGDPPGTRYMLRIARHALLLDYNGDTIVDTDPRKRDRRKITDIRAVFRTQKRNPITPISHLYYELVDITSHTDALNICLVLGGLRPATLIEPTPSTPMRPVPRELAGICSRAGLLSMSKASIHPGYDSLLVYNSGARSLVADWVRESNGGSKQRIENLFGRIMGYLCPGDIETKGATYYFVEFRVEHLEDPTKIVPFIGYICNKADGRFLAQLKAKGEQYKQFFSHNEIANDVNLKVESNSTPSVEEYNEWL